MGERYKRWIQLILERERLTEMNRDVIGESLLGGNPEGIGERLNEMNPDVIGERLLGRNPDGIGERVHEMIPNELMLNNNRLEENVPEARQRGHTLTPQEMNESIIKAAKSKNYSRVIHLIDNCVDLQYTEYLDNNLLHVVLCTRGYHWSYIGQEERDELLTCVIKLVEAGVDVNHLNEDQETPIIIAAMKGLLNIVIYLIDHCVDIQCTDKKQNNVLQLVLAIGGDYGESNDLLRCVIKLVEAGVDVNHMNIYQETPIYIAAYEGFYKVLIYLFVDCTHVDYVAINDQYVLHRVLYTIRFKNEEDVNEYSDDCIQVVKTLIKLGVDVNKTDIDGNTPLFHIAKRSFDTKFSRLQYDLITVLFDAGCNMNHQNIEGQTPLMCYTRKQADTSIVKLLISLSDVNLTDNNADTACSYCVQYRLFNSTNIFKLYPVGVLMSPINGLKLFHQILACKRLELLHYYMILQLIVSGVTTEGENMLHLLARVKYDYSQDKFNWLFNKKLDINHRCSKNNTPIMVAALLLNSKYLELFTRHPRIDINAQNNQGHTALHLCIIGFTMVKDGLDTRQENDAVEDYCSHKYLMYMECVDILLAVGIDVNTQDGGGRTALMMAAMKHDRFLIRKLLNAGAMVSCGRKSALHHLDIHESVFDLNFKLMVSVGDNMLLNLPCITGNTLIQAALCFPRCWDPHTAVSFIKYLVGENCCLQSLVTSSAQSSYNQIDMRELSSQERDKLRKLLYLSGAPENQIVAALNFDKENTNVEIDEMRRLLLLRGAHEDKIIQHLNFQVEDKDNQEVGSHSRHQQIFTNYCCNISLKSQCRRIIRQKLGLGINEKIMDLELPRELNDFLLLKDVLRPKYYSIVNTDDGCNDFDDDDDDSFSFYDSNKNRDGDYSQYNYQYFTLKADYIQYNYQYFTLKADYDLNKCC